MTFLSHELHHLKCIFFYLINVVVCHYHTLGMCVVFYKLVLISSETLRDRSYCLKAVFLERPLRTLIWLSGS